MIRIIKKCLTILLLFSALIFPSDVYALSITISNLPASIDRDQEVEVDLYFVCAGCGDSYIRGVFYPDGTNYFGFTQDNSGNWIGTETNRALYFLIAKDDLIEASWSGKLKVKPDSASSAYEGPGEYLFKMGRYTSSGDSSADWSNELSVRITGPTPTPSPTPTPEPTQAPTTTSTPTIKPSSAPTKTPTPKPTPSPTSTPSASPEEKILGLETSMPTPVAKKKTSFPVLAMGFVVLGVGFMAFAIFSIFKYAKRSYTGESEKEDSKIS